MTMRYRNQINESRRPTIRSNMTNKQPTYNHLNSGGLSQNVLEEAQHFMQNRRKSNDLNTFRSRNNLVGGSINHMITDMN